MSKILKKFCGVFGYKLLPKYYVKNKDYLLKLSSLNLKQIISDLVERKIINSLIQIGANDGVTHDHVHDVIKKFRLQSLLLEPIRESFLNLANNYLNFENVRLENSALSINSEILFLYRVNPKYFYKYGTLPTGITSFYKEHLVKHGIKEKHIIQEKVNQISFDKLLKKYNIISFDLLVIDTEGYDCNIVNNFFLKIKNIRPVIIFEWSHIKQNQLQETLNRMLENKYSFFPTGDDIFCFPIEKNISLQLNK
jgi:FkbM family methyltransferase